MAPDQRTRRAFVTQAIALVGVLPAASAQQGRFPDRYAYVGCYTTTERAAHGDGIHVYRMDGQTGAWRHLQHLGNLFNPSFLIVSRDQKFLYSVHGDANFATAFAIDRNTGNIKPVNRAATGGTNGVHQAIDPTGRFMIVANYATGSVAVLPIAADGSLHDFSQLVPLKGEPGPHRVQQPSSRPHNIVFDPSGKFVLVPDKGLDRIFIFGFDPKSGKLAATEQGSVAARSGYGPRHLAFHPSLPIVWVLDELGSAVTSYHWDAERGSLSPLQILPTIPPEFTGENTAAEIAVSSMGRYVYTSNRGHDSVAIFEVDSNTGLLRSVAWQSTEGKQPRFIALDPSLRFLYAANEKSDNITTFRVNPQNGRLTTTGQKIANLSPVTIAFADV